MWWVIVNVVDGMDASKGGSVRFGPSTTGVAANADYRVHIRTFLTRHCKQEAGFIESVLGQDWRKGCSSIQSYRVFHLK